MARDVNIVGGKELAEWLKTLPKKVEINIMRAALRAGASVIAEEAKKNVSEKTGALKKSIRTSSRSSKRTVMAYARAGGKRSGVKKDQSAFYSAFIEYGSAAHIIKPKKASALRFVAKDGRSVTAKMVNHPGLTARPFMRPAFDAKGDAAVAKVAETIRKRLTKEGINVPMPEKEDNVG